MIEQAPRPSLSASERAMIDAAIAAGKVQRVPMGAAVTRYEGN